MGVFTKFSGGPRLVITLINIGTPKHIPHYLSNLRSNTNIDTALIQQDIKTFSKQQQMYQSEAATKNKKLLHIYSFNLLYP
jgi:hypothetical protein